MHDHFGMLEGFKIPIGWGEVARRTGRHLIDDDLTGLAAQLAYYFFLALFPALLFLVALASFFPLKDLVDQAIAALARFAPSEVLAIVRDQMKQISMNRNGGLLTFGILATIWSASSAISGTMSALNGAYDITEGRPWWKTKLISLGLTLAGGLFVLVSFALVVVGPTLAGPAAGWLGLGGAFSTFWRIVQWPIVFFLIATAMGFVYYFGPDAEQHWEWITPGSLLSTILWILSSLGFRFYATHFGNYNATYGAIAGVIVAMLWLYITALAILVGAEVNAVIEHSAPWGKEAGEKRPGEKKKLGRAAADAYEEAAARGQHDAPAVVPQPVARPLPAAGVLPVTTPGVLPVATPALATSPRRRASDRVRVSDWIVGAAALAAELAVLLRGRLKKVRG